MENEKAGAAMEVNRPYECSGCGECFESIERLRQHKVDCKDEDLESVC